MGDYSSVANTSGDISGDEEKVSVPGPNISQDLKNAYNLTLNEKKKIDNLVKKEYSEKHTTILDESLGDILDKTFNFMGNFMVEYGSKYDYADALLNIEVSDVNSISNKILIHLTAISLMIRESDNIIYIGILFVITSIILYFFNISRT